MYLEDDVKQDKEGKAFLQRKKKCKDRLSFCNRYQDWNPGNFKLGQADTSKAGITRPSNYKVQVKWRHENKRSEGSNQRLIGFRENPTLLSHCHPKQVIR